MDDHQLQRMLMLNRFDRQPRAWDSLAIGEDNKLVSLQMETEQWQSETHKKKVELRECKRGLLRSLVIVVDVSANCLEVRSFNMNRMKLFQDQLRNFVSNYFDQNPISQISIIVTAKSTCQVLIPLSGNVNDVLEAVDSLSNLNNKGEPSIQNSLAVATAILGVIGKETQKDIKGSAPSFSTKEVLMIYGSLTTCDAKPIDVTIKKLVESKITVSVIGLGAQVYVLNRIATETKGNYYIPVSLEHFTDVLNSFVIPPETLQNQRNYMIPFGFASIPESNTPAFDSAQLKANPPRPGHEVPLPRFGGFSCPQCGTRVFSVPCYCPVCRILLVSPAHLTRTLLHLKPLPDFTEAEGPFVCRGCRAAGEGGRCCPLCGETYCAKCDDFIHDCLQNCPGCMEAH